VTLFALVVLIILAMFVLTAYCLMAPGSILRSVLGQNRFPKTKTDASPNVTPKLVNKLAISARESKHTTRTTLAVAGFSLLGVVIIATLGLSGEGVRDLRSQVAAAVTTLAAAIAGFYFGSQTATGGSGNQSQQQPKLGPDPNNPKPTRVIHRPE
jgi:amino acid transporter